MPKCKRQEASLVTVAADVAKRRILIYLPGAGERSSDIATPFYLSDDGSPGAPDGGGRGIYGSDTA
jgi:hypothetical protein